jgi:LysM repeat protein
MNSKFVSVSITVIAINIGVLVSPVEARSDLPARSTAAQTHALVLQQPQQLPQVLAQVCGPTYIVRRGDTLSIISRRCGVTVAAIKRANGLRSDLILIGQRLILPGVRAPRYVPRATRPYPVPTRLRSEQAPMPEATPAPPIDVLSPPTPAIESTVSPW